jgi:hypothetical protein
VPTSRDVDADAAVTLNMLRNEGTAFASLALDGATLPRSATSFSESS